MVRRIAASMAVDGVDWVFEEGVNLLRDRRFKDERSIWVCGLDVVRVFDQCVMHLRIVILADEEDVAWGRWPL